VGNKSKHNYKRKVATQIMSDINSDTPTDIPNFTAGELDIFVVLAEYSQEIERLRAMVFGLGGDPDLRYTSEDLGGRVGDQQPDPELAKMNEEMTYE